MLTSSIKLIDYSIAFLLGGAVIGIGTALLINSHIQTREAVLQRTISALEHKLKHIPTYKAIPCRALGFIKPKERKRKCR